MKYGRLLSDHFERCFQFHKQFWEDPSKLSRPKCIDCEPGSYQPENRGNYCKTCEMGRYTKSKTECNKRCPAGERTNKNTAASGCERCPDGSYNGLPGEYDCFACEAGYYSKWGSHFFLGTGITKCEKCPKNEFMALKGQSQCVSCADKCTSKPANAGTTCENADDPSCPSLWQQGKNEKR